MTFYDDLLSAGRDEEAPLVRVERGSDRAVVTLDDPDKLNVLSAPLVHQLKTGLQELVADRAIRAIVITGADPGFSAGGDLRMMDMAPEALAAPEGATDIWRWIRCEFGAIARLIARSDTAFIAAHGPVASGRMGPVAETAIASAPTMCRPSAVARDAPNVGTILAGSEAIADRRLPARMRPTPAAGPSTRRGRSASASSMRWCPTRTCSPPPMTGARGSRRCRRTRSR